MNKHFWNRDLPPNTIDGKGFRFDYVKFARDFAIVAHGEQQWGNKPYVAHLDGVYRQVHDNHNGVVGAGDFRHILKVCAYLHDILEDTAVSHETLSVVFGWRVANIVEGLTKKKGEEYYVYIGRIVGYNGQDSEYVQELKKADLAVNYWQCCNDEKNACLSLRQRYAKALRMLDHLSPLLAEDKNQ